MTQKEKIKDAIAKELASFLISSKVAPKSIDIQISYPESKARLVIDAEKIAAALNN